MKYYFNEAQAEFIAEALDCYYNNIKLNTEMSNNEQRIKMTACNELAKYLREK